MSKKLLSVFMALIMLFSVITTLQVGAEEVESEETSALSTQGVVGDADKSGEVNVKDATFLQKSIIKFEDFEVADGTRAFYAADVNGDNKLDITDCTTIMKYAVRAIKKFPVEK